jgi:hypothetical protein
LDPFGVLFLFLAMLTVPRTLASFGSVTS